MFIYIYLLHKPYDVNQVENFNLSCCLRDDKLA